MERMGGGRCWFAVDSKSFKISINFVGEKLRGIILKRSRGFSSWIRFGNSSLRCLLEGVAICCREEGLGKVVKSWENEGRRFRLERLANEAGRYIFSFIHELDAKRFCLVFSEGKEIIEGWVLLTDKLLYLGIFLPTKDEVGLGIADVIERRKGEVQAEEEEKNGLSLRLRRQRWEE